MEFLVNMHPVIIHFPIAFFVAYFLLEVAALVTKKDSLCKMAAIFLGAGVIFALIAVLTGNQSHEVLKPVLRMKPPYIKEAIENAFGVNIDSHSLYFYGTKKNNGHRSRPDGRPISAVLGVGSGRSADDAGAG